MTVIHPVATGAYLYHDGVNIRGVSFVDDRTDCDKLIIPIDVASQFVSGELEHRDWVIMTDAVYDTRASLVLEYSDDDYSLIETDTVASPICLTIKLYRAIQHVVFSVVSRFPLETPVSTLRFVFTTQGDPSAVLHIIDIDATELLESNVDRPLPIDPATPIDIYTRRLFRGHRIEHRTEESLMLGLPRRHFIDLMQFERGIIDHGLQAVLTRAEGRLRLGQVGEREETYERPTASLRLLFSLPGDPTLLLHTAEVAIADLRAGTSIPLPSILNRSFDVWSPLFYRKAAIHDDI